MSWLWVTPAAMQYDQTNNLTRCIKQFLCTLSHFTGQAHNRISQFRYISWGKGIVVVWKRVLKPREWWTQTQPYLLWIWRLSFRKMQQDRNSKLFLWAKRVAFERKTAYPILVLNSISEDIKSKICIYRGTQKKLANEVTNCKTRTSARALVWTRKRCIAQRKKHSIWNSSTLKSLWQNPQQISNLI